jgi:hypothetical protein
MEPFTLLQRDEREERERERVKMMMRREER